MIQAAPKNTNRLAPVPLEWQRLLCAQPLADHVRPAEGQGEEREQLLEPRGVGDVRLLQTEAASLQTPEQRLDLPAPRVIGDGALTLALRDDDQILTLRQAHPTDMPTMPPDEARTGERRRLIKATMPEKMPGLHRAPPCVGDLRVGSHADATRDALAPQVREPHFANKLAVSTQVSDRAEPEQAPELIEQGAPLGSRGAAFLFKDRPQHGEGRATISDAQHEDVQGRLSEIPVGAIQCQHKRRGHAQQLEDKRRHAPIRQFKEAEEALRPLVMRGGRGAPREDARHFDEVNASDLNQGDKELRHEVDARFIPRYSAGKRSLQQVNVGHRKLLLSRLIGKWSCLG